MGRAEGEARRGLAAARVVVGAALDDDFGAVAQAALREPGALEVVEPDRRRGRRPRRRAARSRPGPCCAPRRSPRRPAAPGRAAASPPAACARSGRRRTGPEAPTPRPAPRRPPPAPPGRLCRALPAARPGAQLGHRRAQVGALLGQRVADLDRRARLDLALDDAGVLELAQPLREQPVGEARAPPCRARRSASGPRSGRRRSHRSSACRSARSRRGSPGRPPWSVASSLQRPRFPAY